jgi:hypothetical protein
MLLCIISQHDQSMMKLEQCSLCQPSWLITMPGISCCLSWVCTSSMHKHVTACEGHSSILWGAPGAYRRTLKRRDLASVSFRGCGAGQAKRRPSQRTCGRTATDSWGVCGACQPALAWLQVRCGTAWQGRCQHRPRVACAFYVTPTFHDLILLMVRECRMCGNEPCACSTWRRCMSCDRSLLALESDAGPHIAQPGFASIAVEYARANGMDPERSPPPQRALQRPHTSGTIGNDGLYGSTSERLRGAQSWCACSA